MEYPLWRTDRVRRAGIERREAMKRERFDFLDRVLAHVKERRYNGCVIKDTATRRRAALIYLTGLATGDGPKGLSERFGVTKVVARHSIDRGAVIVLEVLRSGVLGPIQGWGLEVVAECERRVRARRGP